MPPPPADSVASRLFLAPALRTQPDRRLVALVREGYELAFEEIVRRYRAPLERFAAAIVGSHSEDVTQDAFSKALLALRGSENEIELRPWLYRIVRNTALSDIRDSPPPTEELGETVAGGASAAVEAERREEISDLTERLRALPETQRAAIVMRELEGLSHEEIAAALGLSGGAARQAIHRARTALRDGVGFLLPLPLLKFLLDGGGEAAAAAGAAGAAGAGGSAAALGGFGAVGAAKIGVAAVLVAGSVGAGVAVEQSNRGHDSNRPASTSTPLGDDSSHGGPGRSSGEAEPGDDHGGHGEGEPGDDRGGRGAGERHGDHGRNGDGHGRGGDDRGHRSDRGHGTGSDDASSPSPSSGSGSGGSDGSTSGSSSSGSGSDGSGSSGSSSGSGSSGSSGGSGSTSGGSGPNGGSAPPSGSSGSSGGSDDSGSGSSGSGGGSDDS
ncbi:MAG TPA: RNA polymerase sigma factor [Solirubrobacterales bacterium]|nr:RNA polymerase sigma factor [Solirubrobacterales bacterium]